MKKIIVLTILFLLCFSLTSCEDKDKKMEGFTYTELAEYLSDIDGLTPLGKEDEAVNLPCKDNNFRLLKSTHYYKSGNKAYNRMLLYDFFQIEVPSDVPQLYPTKNISIFDESLFDKQEYYITQRPPENFAYILRDFEVKCSPEWTEWIDYNIPSQEDCRTMHGFLDELWYNPLTEQFETSAYYRQLEDSTELYVVFQETNLLYSGAYKLPFLMSEEMYEYLKTTYKKFHYEHYKKGTVKDFAIWFLSEDMDKIPKAFANIKADVYYPLSGGGIYDNLKDENFDSVSLFIPDLEKLGVNFDAFKNYIIKATFPHGGTVEDIYWELIG